MIIERSSSLLRSRRMPQRRQRGQVLVWLLGMVATCAAVLYGIYNVGQLTAAKEKVVNAADAGAYAGAMTQARALNFMAYTNRAAIANEVFICQLISLNAWIQYAARTGYNIGTVLSYIPFLNAIGEALKEASAELDDVNEDEVKDVIEQVVDGIEMMKDFHLEASGSNAILYYAAGPLARKAANSTVDANKTTFGARTDWSPSVNGMMDAATFVVNEAQWLDFSERYVDDMRSVAKEVLLAARDRFSSDRPGNIFTNHTVHLPDGMSLGLEKRGGTRLVDFERWEAQDTIEFWAERMDTCGGLIKYPCKKTDYTPIGWGRSTLAEEEESGDEWAPHRYAQQLAFRYGLENEGWSGVPTLRDITDRSEAERGRLGLDYIVVVRKGQTQTLTTSTLGIAKVPTTSVMGSAEMNESLISSQFNAIGKARIYFERPKRNDADFTAVSLFRRDEAKEYGSLYNPFWQVRLAPVSSAEKALVNSALGGPPSGGLATQ